MLKEPFLATPSQERVYEYLRKYICGLSFEKLRTFTRFVTVISVKEIDVRFNNLQGLQLFIVVHLQLSCQFHILKFAADVDAVLSNESCWKMDSI